MKHASININLELRNMQVLEHASINLKKYLSLETRLTSSSSAFSSAAAAYLFIFFSALQNLNLTLAEESLLWHREYKQTYINIYTLLCRVCRNTLNLVTATTVALLCDGAAPTFRSSVYNMLSVFIKHTCYLFACTVITE